MPYPPYVKVTGRFTVEVSALVGAGSLGNYNQIATAKIVLPSDQGKIVTVEGVPIITGNSLKHWHSVYLADNYVALGGKLLNIFCKHGIGVRGYTVDSNFNNPREATSEMEAILDICNDVHGLLVPNKQLKRDSLVEFSNAIPVLTQDNLDNASKFAIQHNRVVPASLAGSEEEEEGVTMMVFKQENASVALYGFAVNMELGWILRPRYEGDGSIVDVSDRIGSRQQESKTDIIVEERKRRARAAMLALFDLIVGFGSKKARALPIAKPVELMVVVSRVPIPNLVHAAYPDYASLSLQMLAGFCGGSEKCDQIHVHCYNVKGCEKINAVEVKKHTQLDELIISVVNEVVEIIGEEKVEKVAKVETKEEKKQLEEKTTSENAQKTRKRRKSE
jgi:CRISPR-associated protein Cst2